MKTYRVEWTIDIDAKTPELAARQALKIQRDPSSWSTVFNVREFDSEGEAEEFDIDALDAKLEEDYINDPRR